MLYFDVLLIFIFITLLTSFIYFFVSIKKEERFMKFWGYSWIVYALSLICLLLFVSFKNDWFLEIRKVFDMFNILLLLFGVFAFLHIEIKTYWYRFSLYMLFLILICMIYQVDLLSYYLPICIFQIVISVIISYNVIKYWNSLVFNKYITAAIFLLWGVGKASLSIIELNTQYQYVYLIELELSLILNLFILTIYIQYSKKETELTGKLYKTLVENVTDVIFYYKLSPYAAFEYVTPSIEHLTGYSPETFYKYPRHYINLVEKKYIDMMKDIFSGYIQSEEGYVMEFIKKDGETFWGNMNVSIITDKKGNPIAVEGSIHDITTMKSAQLEQIKASHSQSLLLSYISHELRSPVTSIAGYLNALDEGVINSEDDVKEAMEIVTTKTMMLKKLLDDLDQLSKLGTHQFSFEFIICSVEELVNSLIHEYDFQIKTTALSSKIDYNKESFKNYDIVVDQPRISQVFANLLNNAIKYSAENSELEISFEIVDDNFITKVTNTKGTINQKDLIYIFEKFYSAKTITQKSQPGRGLGLAICREIILAHKGIIYAENNKNDGTTFTFSIPLYEEG